MTVLSTIHLLARLVEEILELQNLNEICVPHQRAISDSLFLTLFHVLGVAVHWLQLIQTLDDASTDGWLLGEDLGGSLEVSLIGGDSAPELLDDGFLHLDVGRLLHSWLS